MSAKYEFDVNYDEFASRLSVVTSILLPEVIENAMAEACDIVTAEAVTNLMSSTDGDGQLAGSLHSEVGKENQNFYGVVYSNAEYAPYVHEGTGIYAKEGNGRKTPWVYRTLEGDFYTTRGQEPNPFLKDAFEKKRKDVLKCFEERV